jgi:hypothetical protein
VARRPASIQPLPEPRRWVWWLFRFPGHAVIWLRYMYPRRSGVLATGRRYNAAIIEIAYTILIYLILLGIGAFVWFVVTHSRMT